MSCGFVEKMKLFTIIILSFQLASVVVSMSSVCEVRWSLSLDFDICAVV